MRPFFVAALLLLLLLSVVDGWLSPRSSRFGCISRTCLSPTSGPSPALKAFDSDGMFGGISDKNSRDDDGDDDLDAQLQAAEMDEDQQAMYVPAAERLGTAVSGSSAPLKLQNLVVKETMESIKKQLLEDGKVCALDWVFDNFKDTYLGSRDFLEFDKFIEDLIRTEPMQINSSKVSDIDGKVSAQIVQIIDPRAIASMVIKSRIQRIAQLASQLPLILKENAEAAVFSGVCLAEGEAAAKRGRQGIFKPDRTADFKSSFNRLSCLVTNIAITTVRDALLAEGKVVASQYLSGVVDEVSQAEMMRSIIRDAFESSAGKGNGDRGARVDPDAPRSGPSRLLERLLLATLCARVELQSRGAASAGSPTRGLYSSRSTGAATTSHGSDSQAELEGLGQRLIDSRAEIAAAMLVAAKELHAACTAMVKEQNHIIKSLGGFSEITLDGGLVSPSLDGFHFLPVEESPAFSMEVTDPKLLQARGGDADEDDDEDDDNAAAIVVARRPGGSGTSGNSKVGGGAFFGAADYEGRRGWRAEDGSKTKADPAGSRTPTSVLDPPPPPPPRPPDERESSVDESDGKNNVDYGDIEHGTLGDFLNIGSARIRLAGQKTDDNGSPMLCLEATGPQVEGGSFKRWLPAADALLLLQVDTASDTGGDEGGDEGGEGSFGSILLM